MLDKRIDILHDYSKGEVYHCHECGKVSSILHETLDYRQLCVQCFSVEFVTREDMVEECQNVR